MSWDEFWHSHARRNYTPVFNSFLDAQIADVKLPLTLRVLAWVLRNAWGRHSDACAAETGMRRTQVDCARELKVFNRKGEPARNRVNRSLTKLQAWGLVRVVGWDIFPIDPEQPSSPEQSFSPNVLLLSHPNAPIGEGKAKLKVDDYCENVWKLEKPSTYGEYQKIAPRYKELRTELVGDCKAFNELSQRGVTNEENGAANVPKGGDNLSPGGVTTEAPSLIKTSKTIFNSQEGETAPFSPVVEQNRAAYSSDVKNERTSDEAHGWAAFFHLATTARMGISDAEYERRQREFTALPLEKRIAACRGIRQRLESGEYNPETPNYSPTVRNYLLDERWDHPPRPPRKKAAAAGDELLEQWAREEG